MNGAQALLKTLAHQGIDHCFANPGTSEMHFVAALDDVPGVRGILTLFEGVATGAADGYGRVSGRPAATLLHLGPGLGNGLANLHNARRAFTPIVNIVGDHATSHLALDAPLQSDITALASTVSNWVKTSSRASELASDAVEAVRASLSSPRGIATLILPADVSWSEAPEPEKFDQPLLSATRPNEELIRAAAQALREDGCILYVGGDAMSPEGLEALGRIHHHLGTRIVHETFSRISKRGAGIFAPERLGYLAEFARAQIETARQLILVGVKEPVSFFAYPGQPGTIATADATISTLVDQAGDVVAALKALCDELDLPKSNSPGVAASIPEAPQGELTAMSLAQAVAASLPEGAIVVDEANTAGLFLPGFTAGCAPHSWMTLTGGAIGYGMPVATGAAFADTDAPILSLEADGSAMYTFQALWTQAREGCNVTTVILSNRSYAVLNMELDRVGATAAGSQARAMLELTPPTIDFVKMAEGLGVPAIRVTDAGALYEALHNSLREAGPSLIEAVLPVGLG
jgi:acetolactate synthase-1/2/3 large subunit